MTTADSRTIDATARPGGLITRNKLPVLLPWTQDRSGFSCVDKALGAGVAGLCIGSFLLVCLVILAILRPQELGSAKGAFAVIFTLALLISGIIYMRGMYYCRVTASKVVLGRRTLTEKWMTECDLSLASVQVRSGELYTSVGAIPRKGYYVITVEGAGKWMVLGVTRSQLDANQYALQLKSLGLSVCLDGGVFRGYGNL